MLNRISERELKFKKRRKLFKSKFEFDVEDNFGEFILM